MKLKKSKNNVLVDGVLAGIGEYYNVDPTLIRIGFAILTFAGILPMIPLYIIAVLIMPEADSTGKKSNKKQKKEKDLFNNNSKDSFSDLNEIDEDDWSDF